MPPLGMAASLGLGAPRSATSSGVPGSTGVSATAPDEVDDLVIWMDAGANAWTDSVDGTDAEDGETALVWQSRFTDDAIFSIYWSAGANPTLRSQVGGGTGGQNGEPYMDMDDLGTYAKAAENASQAGTATIFWIWNPTLADGNSRYMFKNGGTHALYGFEQGWPNAGRFRLRMRYGTDADVYWDGAPNTDFAVLSIACDLGTSLPIPRRNGGAPIALEASNGSASGAGVDGSVYWSGSASGNNALYLGSGAAGAKMNLYEVFWYNRLLSNAEMDGIHSWIADKYDVTQDTVTDS